MRQREKMPDRERTGEFCVDSVRENLVLTLGPGCFFQETQPLYHLICVLSGCVHAAADGRENRLEPGALMVFVPGQYHVLYPPEGSGAETISLLFDGDGAQSLRNRKLQADEFFTASMVQEQQEEICRNEMVQCLLTWQLIRLLRRTEEKEAVCLLPENRIVSRAQLYISSHLCDRLSVPVLAEHTHVSASYLTALFRQHLHISPGDYIRRAKLQLSKELIREGQLNFTEIARKLQYSTVHHFSRQFKEKLGISPTDYAVSVREETCLMGRKII